MKKQGSLWIDLYNSLYFVSSRSNELIKYESPTFELFDELDSAIFNGLNNSSLELFLSENWINLLQQGELKKFKVFIERIDDEFWNIEDFETYEDWTFARKWASSLLEKIGEKRRGWDSSGEVILIV